MQRPSGRAIIGYYTKPVARKEANVDARARLNRVSAQHEMLAILQTVWAWQVIAARKGGITWTQERADGTFHTFRFIPVISYFAGDNPELDAQTGTKWGHACRLGGRDFTDHYEGVRCKTRDEAAFRLFKHQYLTLRAPQRADPDLAVKFKKEQGVAIDARTESLAIMETQHCFFLPPSLSPSSLFGSDVLHTLLQMMADFVKLQLHAIGIPSHLRDFNAPEGEPGEVLKALQNLIEGLRSKKGIKATIDQRRLLDFLATVKCQGHRLTHLNANDHIHLLRAGMAARLHDEFKPVTVYRVSKMHASYDEIFKLSNVLLVIHDLAKRPRNLSEALLVRLQEAMEFFVDGYNAIRKKVKMPVHVTQKMHMLACHFVFQLRWHGNVSIADVEADEGFNKNAKDDMRVVANNSVDGVQNLSRCMEREALRLAHGSIDGDGQKPPEGLPGPLGRFDVARGERNGSPVSTFTARSCSEIVATLLVSAGTLVGSHLAKNVMDRLVETLSSKITEGLSPRAAVEMCAKVDVNRRRWTCVCGVKENDRARCFRTLSAFPLAPPSAHDGGQQTVCFPLAAFRYGFKPNGVIPLDDRARIKVLAVPLPMHALSMPKATQLFESDAFPCMMGVVSLADAKLDEAFVADSLDLCSVYAIAISTWLNETELNDFKWAVTADGSTSEARNWQANLFNV